MDKSLVFFLLFLVIIGIITYVWVSLKNTHTTELELFGDRKKLTVRSVVLVTLSDGILIGLLLCFLIFQVNGA